MNQAASHPRFFSEEAVLRNDISTLDNIPSLKILVMDDTPGILRVMQAMLERLNDHRVETAKNGEEALEKYLAALACNEPFDLIILDLHIAIGMDGEKTLQELRRIDPRAVAIVSSGSPHQKIPPGFDAILPKPACKKELDAVIKKCFCEIISQRLVLKAS